MHAVLQVVQQHWPLGLILLLVIFFAWRFLPRGVAFWQRWYCYRFRSNGLPAWNWGLELNHRSEAAGRERCLVVFVPGLYPFWPQPWRYTPLIDHFDDVLRSRFAERDYLLFGYPSMYWSASDPTAVAAELQRQISAATAKDSYDAILLIAHSFGGLLVQQLVLAAREENWYPRVERIVLLASPQRGFSTARFGQRILILLARTLLDHRYNLAGLRFGRLVLAGLRGAPWVSDLQARWRTAFSSAEPPPLTFRIVGDRDSLLSREDDEELPRSPNFHQLRLRSIGHGEFTLEPRRMRNPAADKPYQAAIAELRERIAEALREPSFPTGHRAGGSFPMA